MRRCALGTADFTARRHDARESVSGGDAVGRVLATGAACLRVRRLLPPDQVEKSHRFVRAADERSRATFFGLEDDSWEQDIVGDASPYDDSWRDELPHAQAIFDDELD